MALKECDVVLPKVRNFIKLYEGKWQNHDVNARAVGESNKGNVPEELPLESDVKIFRNFLLLEMNRLMKELENNNINAKNVKDLSKVTMARGLTFNARRGAEVSKLTWEHWKGVEKDLWKRRKDIEDLDDPIEKKLAERLKLCYLQGKQKRNGKNVLVPILFTDEVVKAIKLLKEHSYLLELPKDNNYVFGSGDRFLPGWDTLQDLTKKISNLEKPKLITPTRTRKFLATMLQLLDMTDAELTWLTNHFGHTKNVHFAWYRKEDSTIELTKMARVLCAVDSGESVKNKKIDELHIDGEPVKNKKIDELHIDGDRTNSK